MPAYVPRHRTPAFILDTEEVMTVAEAIRVTHLSKSKIFMMLKSGELVSKKVGGRRLVMVYSVRDLLNKS